MHQSRKSGSVSVSGDLTVSGNLTISGNTTTLNTETLAVEDNIVVLNSSVTGEPTLNAGLEVERGAQTNVEFRWNESTDKWQFSNDGTTYVNVASTTDVTNHENDTTNIHGIADTANLVTLDGAQTLTNKTLTSPTITGVSPVITLAGDLTGNVTLSNLGSQTLTAQIASESITNADISNTAAISHSKLEVVLGGSVLMGNASNVATATALTGDVTVNSSGVTAIAANSVVNADISPSASIQLSKLEGVLGGRVLIGNESNVVTATTLTGDISVAADGVVTISANSVALGTDTTGNYVANVTAGTGVTVSHTPGEGSTANISIGQSVATNAEVTFAGIKATSVIEPLTISATAATGTVAIDAANGTTYYTTNASANWVVNLRWNSSTTLDSKLSTGEMTTTSFMARQGATAYYPTSIQVNGTTSGVTTRWQGSTGAPTSGNANSTDMYTFTVVKTGSATFDVFAAQTRFA